MFEYKGCLEFLLSYQEECEEVVIFRGEPKKYRNTVPSLYRLPENKLKYYQAITKLLASHIWDNKLSKHIDISYGFSFHKGEPFGAENLLDPGHDISPKHVSWGLVALMQHYGFPTEWVDYTTDPKVAMTFASQSSSKDPGYIYYGPLSSFNYQHELIDVDNFIQQLRSMLPLRHSRPEQQNALAYRTPIGASGRKGLKSLRFKKDDPEICVMDTLYPRDGIRTWLMGQLVDYHMALISSVKGVKLSDRNNDLLRSVEEIIEEFELW